MKRSRFTDSQIMDALKRVNAGLAAPDICRDLGISSVTFQKQCAKFGCIDTSLIARMRELGAENARLKKMYFDEKLKVEIVTEALAKSGKAFGVSESCYRYEVKNEQITNWLIRLANNNRGWGFGLCCLCLCNTKNFKSNDQMNLPDL